MFNQQKKIAMRPKLPSNTELPSSQIDFSANLT